MKRRTFLGTGAALAVASTAGCLGIVRFGDGAASETVEQSYSPGDVGELRVRNVIGDVTVTATDTDEVHVRVIKRSTSGQEGLDDIHVRMGVTGGTLTVQTELADRARWFSRSSPTTDVTVRVPRGESGPAVTALGSDLGDVHAAGVGGYLSLRSELGDVTASDVTDLDGIHTELGDVKADLLGIRGDVEVGTELGSVTVGVADDLDLTVLAESESEVTSDLSLSDAQMESGRISGRLNDGGPRLHVFSELGDVALRAIQRRD